MRGSLSSSVNPYGAASPWVQKVFSNICTQLIYDLNGKITAYDKATAVILGQTGYSHS